MHVRGRGHTVCEFKGMDFSFHYSALGGCIFIRPAGYLSRNLLRAHVLAVIVMLLT